MKIGKRFLTDSLIVLLGVVILFISGLITYTTWFVPADELADNPNFYISEDSSGQTLWIRNQEYISNTLSKFQGDDGNDGFSRWGFAMSAGGLFASTDLSSTYVDGATAYKGSLTQTIIKKALEWSREDNNVAGSSQIINQALKNYDFATVYSGTNYRIRNNILYVHSKKSYFDNAASNGYQSGDLSVSVGPHSFPDYSRDDNWAFYLDISSNRNYVNPKNGSLALGLMSDALNSANNAVRADERLRSQYDEAPTVVMPYRADVEMIQAAIDRYKSQIPSDSANRGLTLSAPESIEYGGEARITYELDMQNLGIEQYGSVTDVILSIENVEACHIVFNGTSSSTGNSLFGCTWDANGKSGRYTLNDQSGGETNQNISSNNPGEKVLKLAAYSGTHELVYVNKTLYVRPDFDGESEESNCTEGSCGGSSGVRITVKTPNAISRADDTIKEVPVTINASGLNTSGQPKKVEYISWYVCHKDRSEVMGSAEGSEGCEQKDRIAIGDSESTKNITVDWDASGTPAGVSSIMVKAFAPKANASATSFPYINGTKIASNNITITDESSVRGAGGGSGAGGESTNPPSDFGGFRELIANIQHSSIGSLSDLLSKIGPFSLMILGFLAVLGIVIAGMKYITAGGDEKRAETGKKAILFTVYGIIIAVTSITLVNTTINEVGNILGTSTPKGNDINTILEPINTQDPNSSDWGGPNADLREVIGQDSGIVWRFIRLAALYAEITALFFILYASFVYMTSYGDESKAESGKKILVWALVGLGVVISATTVLNFFGGVFT